MALEGLSPDIFSVSVAPGEKLRVISYQSSYDSSSIIAVACGFGIQFGFVERDIQELEIVVRELLANISRHGGGEGTIVFYSRELADRLPTLIIDFMDNGPGFPDYDLSLHDNTISGFTPGGGLPSARRFCDRVELMPNSPKGAIVRITKSSSRSNPHRIGSFVVLSKPHLGETHNGDQATVIHTNNFTLVALVDGLGHGLVAFQAAKSAITIIEQNYQVPLDQLIKIMHIELMKTRGAAVSLAKINYDPQTIDYLGIGNVNTALISNTANHLVNYNGTVGLDISRSHVVTYKYELGMRLIMYTDGLASNWMKNQDLNIECDALQQAHTILSSHARPTDDATLVLGKLMLWTPENG